METANQPHVCRFADWGKRVSPAGGNRRKVSLRVSQCTCGRLRALYPAQCTYWDLRWIERQNKRMDRHNGQTPTVS